MAASPVVTNAVLLLSSHLNIGLYALELVLCWRYFERPNRPRLYRLGVAALVFLDTVCTLTICINVCVFVLGFSYGGDEVAAFAPTSVIIFTTNSAAAVEQAILSHIFFTFTGNKFISGVLAILILGHMGVAFASGALILTLDSELSAALTITTVSSVTCAATDLIVAFSLGAKVWNMMSRTDVLPPSHSVVRKVFLLIVSSGVIVASNTLIIMGLLLRHSPAFDFLFTCQGRVYSLTLLANFLVGIHFRRDTSKGTASTEESRESSNTGVVFDTVHGYDTTNTSYHSRRDYGAESKPLTSVQFSYPPSSLAESNPVCPEHWPSLRINSEP